MKLTINTDSETDSIAASRKTALLRFHLFIPQKIITVTGKALSDSPGFLSWHAFQ
ncbi:MAG: hypothetical protein PUD05_02225 [Lachnospiraceae bacterium]|nr:hypothetical protein [Lachnospiraceae bacterium]